MLLFSWIVCFFWIFRLFCFPPTSFLFGFGALSQLLLSFRNCFAKKKTSDILKWAPKRGQLFVQLIYCRLAFLTMLRSCPNTQIWNLENQDGWWRTSFDYTNSTMRSPCSCYEILPCNAFHSISSLGPDWLTPSSLQQTLARFAGTPKPSKKSHQPKDLFPCTQSMSSASSCFCFNLSLASR